MLTLKFPAGLPIAVHLCPDAKQQNLSASERRVKCLHLCRLTCC